MSLLHVDPMELEIGYGLIPLVDAEQGGDMLDRVVLIRRQMALELGIVVPSIRIRDNMELSPDAYVVRIKGVEVGRGQLLTDKYLAMDSGRHGAHPGHRNAGARLQLAGSVDESRDSAPKPSRRATRWWTLRRCWPRI